MKPSHRKMAGSCERSLSRLLSQQVSKALMNKFGSGPAVDMSVAKRQASLYKCATGRK